MSIYKKLRPLIFMISPELAHNLALKVIHILPKQKPFLDPILKNEIFGMNFPTPVGMAAGFDKNGTCINALINQGLSFVEVGTITPIPQYGNQKPRLFRIEKHEALINKMGFNNNGIDALIKNLSKIKKKGIVGINIGRNKDGTIEDYAVCIEKCYQIADYIAINISSPNTIGLRSLQNKPELEALLNLINIKTSELKAKYNKSVPFLLKISPDNNEKSERDIAEISIKHKIDGLIISNTTSSNINQIRSLNQYKDGGISGKPLRRLSNKAIKNMYKFTNGALPIIATGGIFKASDAYEKIKLGASLVQLYTGIVYEGFGIVHSIQKELAIILKKNGFKNIKEAIGVDNILK